MFLQTLTLATFLIAAPDGPHLLIDALVQVEAVEDLRIERLPPAFVWSWESDPSDFNNVDAITQVEYEKRLDALQPVIETVVVAANAPGVALRATLIPEHPRTFMLSRSRRLAPLLLIADAERRVLAGESQQAAVRIASALKLCAFLLENPLEIGGGNRHVPGATSISLAQYSIPRIRQTILIAYPHLSEVERALVADSLDTLAMRHAEFERLAPTMFTVYLFEFARDIDQMGRYGFIRSIRKAAEPVWDWIDDDSLPSRLDMMGWLADSTVDFPLVRSMWWPGIYQLYESASIDDHPSASLHRYAHACIRGDAGEYGIAVQRDASVFRMICRNFFSLGDDIAAMQQLLDGHPPIEVEPGSTAITVAGLRAAFAAEMDGSARGRYESTRRAAEIAMSLRDLVTILGPETTSEADRAAILRDLENLRPDDPLRFEANSRRVTERMYLQMHHQIETVWTTRERFRDHAPEWFASRGVPQATTGVQKVIDWINPDQDFQSRLHELARGWLASELSHHGSVLSDIHTLRYPADEVVERWEDDEVDSYHLHFRGPMAAYLARDWFDDLAAVQEGTHALWELRDLLEANHKEN